MEWITNNWIYVAIGIIGIVVFAIFWKYKGFKLWVYNLVCLAEENIVGTKRGQERFDYVIGRIYGVVPTVLRVVLTRERIKGIIEWAVRLMKENIEREIVRGEEREEKK